MRKNMYITLAIMPLSLPSQGLGCVWLCSCGSSGCVSRLNSLRNSLNTPMKLTACHMMSTQASINKSTANIQQKKPLNLFSVPWLLTGIMMQVCEMQLSSRLPVVNTWANIPTETAWDLWNSRVVPVIAKRTWARVLYTNSWPFLVFFCNKCKYFWISARSMRKASTTVPGGTGRTFVLLDGKSPVNISFTFAM